MAWPTKIPRTVPCAIWPPFDETLLLASTSNYPTIQLSFNGYDQYIHYQLGRPSEWRITSIITARKLLYVMQSYSTIDCTIHWLITVHDIINKSICHHITGHHTAITFLSHYHKLNTQHIAMTSHIGVISYYHNLSIIQSGCFLKFRLVA